MLNVIVMETEVQTRLMNGVKSLDRPRFHSLFLPVGKD